MRVAFVHDWLVSYRGGERVLEALLELFPDAPVYTLFYDPKSMPISIREREIHDIPSIRPFRRIRKLLLPLYPTLIESFDLEDYDLVISTSSCVAKGVITGPQTKHLCYIHSPMRYIWDQRQHYFASIYKIPVLGLIAKLMTSYLRLWDTTSANRVDRFIANSSFINDRVKRFYQRDAAVIPPPVDVDSFRTATAKQTAEEPYFLVAGAFVPYKRFDLAIKACESIGKRLIVAGSGPDEKKLKSMTKSPLVSFVSKPDKNQWIDLFRGAQALIFPGVEDFGITAIEAMSAGTPVIAFKAGGALDFIEPGKNGEFFTEASVKGLAEKLASFDASHYASSQLTEYANAFEKHVFQDKITKELSQLVGGV